MFVVLFVLAIIGLTMLLAGRKGYNPLAWSLSGLLGMILLAFLPRVEGDAGDGIAAATRRIGNTVGVVISLIAGAYLAWEVAAAIGTLA